jgi:putative copper export protein
MIFIRFALLPALDALGDDARRTLHEQIRQRWSRLIQLSILFLLASGLVNFGMFVIAARDWPDAWRTTYNRSYQMLFGIKFLLALVIFALSSILAGKSAGTQKVRDNPRFWLNLNLTMALAVIIISGVMRLTHVGPTDPAGQRTVEAKTGG